MKTHLVGNRELPGGGRLIQVAAGGLAGQVSAGQWCTLRVGGRQWQPAVLDASASEDWLAFQLPPRNGNPLRTASHGTEAALDGPFGAAISAPPAERRLLVLCDGTGLPAVLFAARTLEPALAFAELPDPPPIRIRPSRFIIPGMPAGAIAGLGLLEDAGIPSRIASPDGAHGCADGGLETLLSSWLGERSARQRWETAAVLIGQAAFVERMAACSRGQFGQSANHILPAP